LANFVETPRARAETVPERGTLMFDEFAQPEIFLAGAQNAEGSEGSVGVNSRLSAVPEAKPSGAAENEAGNWDAEGVTGGTGEAGGQGALASDTFANKSAGQTPEEALDKLFKNMHTQRLILLAVLEQCRQITPADALDAKIDQMQQTNRSVYGAANLCEILERAGALERVDAQGRPFVEAEVEPRVVEIDGAKYYEPADPAAVHWRSTALGLAKVDANDPATRLAQLLEKEAHYAPIYACVLEMASSAGGTTAAALADALDADPLLQKPRYYAPRFVNLLEACEAIEWRGAWFVTELGAAALGSL
jgi:hypothetical protein